MINFVAIMVFKMNKIYFFFVVKPELLKVADVQTHACAKISRICAKFGILNAKEE